MDGAVMRLYYKDGEMPDIRWVVNERDVSKRKMEMELGKVYSEGYKAWQKYYEGGFKGCNRFSRLPAIEQPSLPYTYKLDEEELQQKNQEDIMDAQENIIGVDVSEELRDLLKVYIDAEEKLKSIEADALASLTYEMKRFLAAQDKRKEISYKLHILKAKICKGVQD